MLFYSQIKREFTRTSWQRGQVYFREHRVANVKLDGDTVSGQIRGTDAAPYETSIVMARGTIFNSKCSCPAHRQYETHCKHVAALAIWIVERGSLLRSGLGGDRLGVAPNENGIVLRHPQRAAEDRRLRKLLLAHPFLAYVPFVIRRDLMAGVLIGKDLRGAPFSIPVTSIEAIALLEHAKTEAKPDHPKAVEGEPVLFVRGIFQGRAFSALTVESAIRYRDPQNHTIQVNTLTYLTRKPEPGLWMTTHNILIQVPVPPPEEEANFIQRLEQSKVIYQGQAALENLAKLLTHRDRHQMVFDPAVNVRVETLPMRLVSLSIGKKVEQQRSLSYQFESSGVRLSSEELEELNKFGRLSANYVWKDDRIYRFGISLSQLFRYANRSGVAAIEGSEEEGNAPPKLSAFGAIADTADRPLHPIAAYRLSLELGVDQFQVDTDWEEFSDWRKTFEKKRIPALPEMEYGFQLREYQKNGLSWLWSLYHRGLSGLLADEMGLGKTHQVLAFLTTLYGRKKSPKKPSLVIAPTSVIAAWIQKLKKYDTGLNWHVFHGAGRTLPDSGADLVLTTYGILQRESLLRDREWHTVILDEAQMVKNAGTISSRATRALKAEFRVAMTGTPIENQATDLWSLMEFLLPGYLGSLPRFKRLYGTGREIPPEVQSAALKRLVTPFLLRRTKAQVLKELPEKTEEVVHCEMTPIQKKIYREFLYGADATNIRESLQGQGKVDYANVLALLTRLKQVCDHPKLPALTSGSLKKANPFESGKWEAFDELVSEALGSNLKIVVFTQYLGMMDLVGRYLKEKEVRFVDLRGDTTDREQRLERFRVDPDCRVFVCSLLAGGLGIDLTAGSVCIHMDRWWNPAKENQATDRLHRIGQTRGVQVFKLQIPGSVEDRIASIIESKIQLSGALIEESSLGLKSFSRKDLLEILAPDGVNEEPAETGTDEERDAAQP